MTLAFFDDHRTNLSRHDECLINSSSLFSTLLTANTTVINIYFHYLLHLWKFLLEVTFTWAGRTEINFHYSFFRFRATRQKGELFTFCQCKSRRQKKSFVLKGFRVQGTAVDKSFSQIFIQCGFWISRTSRPLIRSIRGKTQLTSPSWGLIKNVIAFRSFPLPNER